MKKVLVLAIITLIGSSLAGCDDNKFQLSKLGQPKDKPTISEMIATGKEEMTSECKKGDVSLDCEFLTGDLIGAGNWHHTKIYLYNSGKVGMSVDDKNYYQHDISNSTQSGNDTTTFKMRSVSGDHGEVNVIRSNKGNSLTFQALNSDDKRFVMGGIKLN